MYHSSRLAKRKIRHKRVRAKVRGTKERPRLSVYRSNKHIFLQLINDETGKTLVGISDKSSTKTKKAPKSDFAFKLGKLLAEKAVEKSIKKAVFDRGGYSYHGRVKKAAEGAREGGLEF